MPDVIITVADAVIVSLSETISTSPIVFWDGTDAVDQRRYVLMPTLYRLAERRDW